MKRYTSEEIQMRLIAFIGGLLGLCLLVIVIAIVYSIVFVSQPMNQAPNDKEMLSQLNTLSTFLTGTLSGLVGASAINKIAGSRTPKKAVQKDEKPSDKNIDLP